MIYAKNCGIPMLRKERRKIFHIIQTRDGIFSRNASNIDRLHFCSKPQLRYTEMCLNLAPFDGSYTLGMKIGAAGMKHFRPRFKRF